MYMFTVRLPVAQLREEGGRGVTMGMLGCNFLVLLLLECSHAVHPLSSVMAFATNKAHEPTRGLRIT